MGSTALTVKFVLFLALEVFAVATLGAVLILGLHHFITERIRRSRSRETTAPGTHPASPAGAPAAHQSA